MKTRLIALSAIALTAAVTTSTTQAAIIAFTAESGTLGSNWETVANDADTTTYPETVTGSLTGSIITALATDSGNSPGDAGQVATYSVTFGNDTYDLWARVYVNPAGNQTGSNSTTVGGAEDSFFAGVGFGTQSVGVDADWYHINSLSADANDPDAGVANNTWTWVNLTEVYDGTLFGGADVTTYTSSGATETFQIGNREMGLWIDGFAFVTSTETPTTTQLDNALIATVPEPSALILGAMGSLLLLRRRR